jgi:hypothetical protein
MLDIGRRTADGLVENDVLSAAAFESVSAEAWFLDRLVHARLARLEVRSGWNRARMGVKPLRTRQCYGRRTERLQLLRPAA